MFSAFRMSHSFNATDFIYPHKKTMAFPAPIFMELVGTQQYYVHTCNTEMPEIGQQMWKVWTKVKSGFHCADFHQTDQNFCIFADIFCTERYPKQRQSIENAEKYSFIPTNIP
jgi:hypothetical protein